MAQKNPLHSAREKLLHRCKEIGLNEKETELVKDLLGWNYCGDKVLPKSYLGVEPHLTARASIEIMTTGSVNLQDIVMWKSIEDLIGKIVGVKLMFSVCTEPVKFLEEAFGLPRCSVVWLAMQLHLSEVCPELIPEMFSFMALTLGQMGNRVVMPTIDRLLHIDFSKK